MNRSVLRVAPMSGRQIEEDAVAKLRSFQPTALCIAEEVNVERFFENRLPGLTGVETDYKDLPEGIFGYTDSEENLVVVSAALVSTEDIVALRRGRATIAHECFHALSHLSQVRRRNLNLHSVNDSRHMDGRLYRQEHVPAFRNAEWQAWRWARAFLMPREPFRRMVERGATRQDLAAAFNVNPKFVDSRLRDLEKS